MLTEHSEVVGAVFLRVDEFFAAVVPDRTTSFSSRP